MSLTSKLALLLLTTAALADPPIRIQVDTEDMILVRTEGARMIVERDPRRARPHAEGALIVWK